jgi:hypothetical protein
MFSSIVPLRRCLVLVVCLFFILVIAYGALPIHLSHAQAPIGDSAQAELNGEAETESLDGFGLDEIAANAVVPTGLVGVWKGTIRVDPNYGGWTFSALLTLVDGNVGEIVGTTAHPSVKCGGKMRLQNAASDTVITASDYTFGPCLDGTHVLRLASDGTMLYEWHDPHSSRVDRGTLTKVGGVGTTIPSGYKGVWKGTVTQVNPNGQWLALIALVNGSVGSVVGTYASPTSNCGGELVLLSVNSDSIELLHDITYGSCWDNGVDTLRLVTDDTLEFHWRSPDHTSTASGTLFRISGSLNQTCTLPNFGDDNGNPLRQDVGTWSDDPYGGTDYVYNGQTIFLPFRYYGNNRDTIAAWGCYLTSAAMIVNYYAEQQGSSFRTDPGLLNDWLQHHNGYSTGDPLPSKDDPQYVNTSFVRPNKVAEYANSKIQMAYIGQDRVNVKHETIEQFIARTRATVDASMCALNPIIMGVMGNYGQHFVDSTGTQTVPGVNTWRIHDPIASTPTTLNTAYSNEYNQIVRFSGNSPDRVLSIEVHSPVEIIFIDSEGRRTGYDPRTDTIYHEIPGSSYGVELLAAIDGGGGVLEQTVLDITSATLGEYILQAIGTDSGLYTLEIVATNDLGEGILTRFGRETYAGNVDTFSITYSSSTGQPVQISERGTTIYLPIIAR